MSVTLRCKTVPITSIRSKTYDVRARPTSTSGVPLDTGPLGELAVTRGAEETTEIYTEGVCLSASARAPGLTRANLRRLEAKDPVAAALASVVSLMPPSETTPTSGIEVANAKVKAWRRTARKGKGKDAPLGTMFKATWGKETFRIPHGGMDWSSSAQSSEWEPVLVSGEPTPPEEPKEHECLKPGLSHRGVAPEPKCVDGGLPRRMAAPKLALDETMELLSRVLRAGDEDPDLSALSAALKTKFGLSDLKEPPPTMSPGVDLLTRDVKSCRGIRSSPIDTCPNPFHPRVRIVPVCSVGVTREAEMKGCGLAALAPLATVYPFPPSGGTGDTGFPGRGTKPIATANLQIELPECDPKNLPERAEEFPEFLLLTDQQHADVRTKCTLIKKSCKKEFLQRQVKTAFRKSSNCGYFLKRLEQMYPVYETDLSVRTEIEELPPLHEFPTAARISEFVARLEELMGRMNPSSYGPTEPHLWLVGKIPTRTSGNCRETSKRKSRTHSYDDLLGLLIELAMERQNDSHMDKYLRKHLRRQTPAEKSFGERSPHPNSNPGKGRCGQLRHMTETAPSKGKGAPNLFYFRPTDDKGGPCHAPDCDGRSACMLQLKRTQKNKDGQEVKHQDHFRCMIRCGYCGERRHYEDECHIKHRESEKLKKAEEERRRNAGKGGTPEGGGLTLEVLGVRVTLVEDEGPQRPPPPERRTCLDLLKRTWKTSIWSEADDEEMTLPDPEVLLVYSLHYAWDLEDELPPETMGRMKKQEKGKSNLHPAGDVFQKLESMNLEPRLNKLIQNYQEVFGALPPPLSCKKLVQMDLKVKPEFEGSVVRRRPYPAPQDQIDEIERQIQECIDAGFVEEYKHGVYFRHCRPCFLVAKPGSTAMRLVVDYGAVNKKTQNHSGTIPNMAKTLERITKCQFKTKMDKRSGFWQVDLTGAAQELLAFETPQGRVFRWKVMPVRCRQCPCSLSGANE